MTGLRGRRLRRGSKINDWLTILARINPGASDAVFLVWSHRDWCPMACKVFRSERRAKREAAALSSLRHPNIIRCLGYQEPHYTLMEYLEGPTLGRLISRQPNGRLSVSDAVRVAIHIGAALVHIHSKGLLHMDLKPDNIIVVHGRPVLFDFGSMRMVGGARPPHVDGTDPYIAPEEAMMKDAAEAADVFSFGVILFEMLTGELPFPDAQHEGALAQVTAAPKRLSLYRPNADQALETLIMTCLDKEPSRRPPLKKLLPKLHSLIKKGPAMWPKGLKPQGRASAPSRHRNAGEPVAQVTL